MKNIDLILSRFVFVLIVIYCAAYGIEYYCGWRAVKKITCDNAQLKGARMESLFERTPILPDRVVFYSRLPEMMLLEYGAGRWGLLKYPKASVIVVGDVVDACGDNEEP